LTDALGRKTDFRNTVLVMTSNLGAQHFRTAGQLGFAPAQRSQQEAAVEQAVLSDARKTFRPEFWGRLDGTPVFHPLEEPERIQVARLLLGNTRARLEQAGIGLQISEQALACLARSGNDRLHGARPLRRAITDQIEDPAADLMLSGSLTAGKTLCVETAGDKLKLTAQ
ncbi:MAG: ATP-dependent Clp protease ATP-binding subunit, partial [Oscillospiraceae bacterium]|nr:ATP-dependent Clp protease ATP-binding subunit [Oscillospiraceae bacterium]